MRIVTAWMIATAIMLLVACGGSDSSTAVSDDEQPEQRIKATQVASTEQTTKKPLTGARAFGLSTGASTPTPTAIPEPLTVSEEQDEGDFLSSAPTFIEIRGSGQYGSIGYLKSVTKGVFQIAVVRVGPFKITGKESGEEEYFRVDLKVDNVGDQKGVFDPSAVIILDEQGNRYEVEPDASDHTIGIGTEFMPEDTVRSYLLFQPVVQTPSIKLSFELGLDDNGTPHEFMYDLDLSRVEWD